MSEGFTADLRERSEWAEATDNRFTRELGAGTLPDAAFRRYLVQDYAFVGALASAVGHAAAEAPTMAAKARLARFLGTLTGDEDAALRRLATAFPTPCADRAPRQRAAGDGRGAACHLQDRETVTDGRGDAGE